MIWSTAGEARKSLMDSLVFATLKLVYSPTMFDIRSDLERYGWLHLEILYTLRSQPNAALRSVMLTLGSPGKS